MPKPLTAGLLLYCMYEQKLFITNVYVHIWVVVHAGQVVVRQKRAAKRVYASHQLAWDNQRRNVRIALH